MFLPLSGDTRVVPLTETPEVEPATTLGKRIVDEILTTLYPGSILTLDVLVIPDICVCGFTIGIIHVQILGKKFLTKQCDQLL